MIIKTLRLISLVGLSLLFFGLCQAEARVVRTGIYSIPPLIVLSDQKSPDSVQGIFPELLQHVARQEGWQLEFVRGTWAECLSRLEKGEIDLLPAIAITRERTKRLAFSRETVVSDWGQVFVSSSTSSIQSIIDLDGKTVAVMKDSVFYVGDNGLRQLAEAFKLQIDYLELNGPDQVLAAVTRGEADAGLVNRIYALPYEYSLPIRKTSILVSPFEILFATRLGADAQLLGKIDTHLARLKQNPTSLYYRSLENWLGQHSERHLPPWLPKVMILIALLVVLLLASSLWGRFQVKRKTAELKDSNRELRMEVAERKQVEALLREQAQLLEQVREAVFTTDSDNLVTSWNRGAQELFGYSPDEILGNPVFQLFPEPLGEDIPATVDRLLQGESEAVLEIRLLRRSGVVFFGQISLSPLRDDGGIVQGVVFSVRDITESKEAEQALKSQFDQVTAIFDALDAVVYVADLETYDLLYINQSGESLWGQNWPGRKCYQVLQKDMAGPCAFCTNDQLVVNGEIQPPVKWEFQNTVTQRWYQCIDRAITWPDGRLVRLEIAIDVTEQRQAKDAVAAERAFLQAVVDGVVDPIMVIAPDYRIVMMNQAARQHLRSDLQQMASLCCHQVSHGSDVPCQGSDHPCPLEQVKQTGQPVTVIHQHVSGPGERRIYELEASPMWDANGTLTGIIEVSRDITDRLQIEARLNENEQRLHHLAHHDPLTDLPNRLLFQDRLQHAMSKARRQNLMVGLLFIDLDRFKVINDTLGHEMGDRVLTEVAKRIRYWVRASDTVARLGGDEFVIILEDIQDSTYVGAVAQKILGVLTQPVHLDEQELFVTASIGVSLFPIDTESPEELMKFADVAMYRAKDKGRNTCQFFTPDMNARAHELLALEGSLRKALDNDQLVLHYQPQIDLNSGELVGMEALLRWQHPQRGLVSPGEFIPLAEETGIILPIGEWVLKTACLQNRAWQEQGFPPVRMSVNISARQFRQADLVDMIDRVLEETGLDPQWLELEITESIIMEDFGEVIMTLTDLKVRGVHLAIDDFGTGYSSLAYLKLFPISKLKIDQGFVRDITNDANDASIAASIVALARSMNLEVIAEGIETREQLEFLLDYGCHQGQGFLFGRPLPQEQCLPFLATSLASGSDKSLIPS
ncbi:MAG: EAL domain-containing protein [Desulfuromonadales bacterium]